MFSPKRRAEIALAFSTLRTAPTTGPRLTFDLGEEERR